MSYSLRRSELSESGIMWNCKKCDESLEDSFDICWKCGTEREGVVDDTFAPEKDLESELEPETPHFVANGLVWILRFLALVGGTLGVININSTVEMRDQFQGVSEVDVFASMILALAMVTVPLALSELLRLAISIERNTRTS